MWLTLMPKEGMQTLNPLTPFALMQFADWYED